MKTSDNHPVLVTLNCLLGAVLLFFFLFTVPWRYPLISVFFVVLGFVCLGAAAGLALKKNWGRITAQIASGVAITFGVAFIVLSLTAASYLAGVYGGMGKASMSVYFILISLAAVFLLLLPGLQLYHLRRPRA